MLYYQGRFLEAGRLSRDSDGYICIFAVDEHQNDICFRVDCRGDKYLEEGLNLYGCAPDLCVVMVPSEAGRYLDDASRLVPLCNVVGFTESYEEAVLLARKASETGLDNNIALSDLQIGYVTVLSVGEADSLPVSIRVIDSNWWTRTPGMGIGTVGVVYQDNGRIYLDGDVCSMVCGVRPALQICNLESLNLGKYDKFTVGKFSYTVISDDMVLCDDIVGACPFNNDMSLNSDYDKSYLKTFVKDWSREQGFTQKMMFDWIRYEYERTQNPVYKHAIDMVESGELSNEEMFSELESAIRVHEKLSKIHKNETFVREEPVVCLAVEESFGHTLGE